MTSFALASARSVGLQMSFGDKSILKIHDLAKFDFKGIDIVSELAWRQGIGRAPARVPPRQVRW